MKKKVDMVFVKSTKNTHVYADNSPNAPIPSVYIKKEALGDPHPMAISLTIESVIGDVTETDPLDENLDE